MKAADCLHFATPQGEPACGADGDFQNLTDLRSRVTCPKCLEMMPKPPTRKAAQLMERLKGIAENLLFMDEKGRTGPIAWALDDIRLLLHLQARQIAELQSWAHTHIQHAAWCPLVNITYAADAELPLKEGT